MVRAAMVPAASGGREGTSFIWNSWAQEWAGMQAAAARIPNNATSSALISGPSHKAWINNRHAGGRAMARPGRLDVAGTTDDPPGSVNEDRHIRHRRSVEGLGAAAGRT